MAWCRFRYKSIFMVCLLVLAMFTGLLIFADELVIPVRAAKNIYVPGNYSTIQGAIDNASAGDTIYVWDGVYNETIVINKTITLIGNGSENTHIFGNGTGFVIEILANWVNISGFKVNNSGIGSNPYFDSGIKLENVNNVTITKCNCSDNEIGIFLYNSTNNRVVNNTCTNNVIEGIFLYISNSNYIYNNSCSNNLHGLVIDYSSYNTISNLTSFNNSAYGIWLIFSNSHSIYNSTIHSNSNHGLYLYASNENEIYDNFVYKNTKQSSSINGIYLRFSNKNIVDNNICQKNKYANIRIVSGTNNTIKDNLCIGTDDSIFGIRLSSTSYNVIYNNTFKCSTGIRLYTSTYNQIENNNCSFNKHFGIDLSINSSFNTIANNSCSNIGEGDYGEGILVYYSEYNHLNNNTCNENRWTGITLRESKSIKLRKNTMTSSGLYILGEYLEFWNNHDIDTSNKLNKKPIHYWKNQTTGMVPIGAGQIILANCTNVHVENQSIIDSWQPIRMVFSSMNSIKNNEISNNKENGINLYKSDNNLFSNNTCYKSQYSGFTLFDSNNNTFHNNNASENNYFGIFINHSVNNTLEKNHFHSNLWAGLRIRNSNNNSIYHNTIVNNAIQAQEMDNSRNQWDNGAGEGNYWSDYTGLDNGANSRTANDGIGDTEIPHLDLDNYPFVNKSGWYSAGIPILSDPGDYDTDGFYNLEWTPSRGAKTFILEEDSNITFNSPDIVYNGNDTRFNFTNHPNGTFYYRLKGVGEKYASSWSNIVDIIIDWPPEQPKDFQLEVWPYGNALNLTWNNTAVDVDYYELYYKKEKSSNWQFLSSFENLKNSYDHAGLMDGTKYEYRMVAYDNRGQNSEFSKVISGIPKDSMAPMIPKGLKVNKTTNNSIQLTWHQNTESDLEGYNIYKFTTASPDSWGELVGTVPAENDSFIDDGLLELTTYYYVLTAFDEVPNESNYSTMVTGKTLLGPHPPEINESVDDFEIFEDTIDSTTINLYEWFKDKNQDPLEFSCEGQENISVEIFQSNGTVIIVPTSNWSGSELLTFSAYDGVFNTTFDVKITVLPLNDPPGPVTIIEPATGIEVYENITINFTGSCTDPDIQYSDVLFFNWSSNLQGVLGSGEKLFNIKLVVGIHQITLNVTDKSGSYSTKGITITVKELPSEPDIKDDDDDDSDESEPDDFMNLYLPILVIVIIIVLLFLILIKKHRIKEKANDEESSVSRFSFLSLRVSSPQGKQSEQDEDLEESTEE